MIKVSEARLHVDPEVTRPGPKNRVDAVHGAIREMMESGDLKPGDKLPSENVLSGKYKVSRPVVREAIARLAATGHVRTEHGKGSYVAENDGFEYLRLSSITSIDDLLAWQELRLAIEGEAARLAATRRSQDDLDEIVRRHEMMVNSRRPYEHSGNADHAFHMAIAAAAHNEVVLDAQRALGGHIKGWISTIIHVKSPNVADREQYRLNEHHAILMAIRYRDPDGATHALRSHIENGRSRFLARLSY